MDQYHAADANRRLAAVLLRAGGFGLWSAMASPGTAPDQIKTIRAAFTKALNDASLLDEAKKKSLEVSLITGEELENLAKEVVAQPPDLVAQLKKLLGG
jgi:tripartite-type tricarboxylate transporter receptor subunit TctC